MYTSCHSTTSNNPPPKHTLQYNLLFTPQLIQNPCIPTSSLLQLFFPLHSISKTSEMVALLSAAAHSLPGRPSYQHDRHLIYHTSSSSLYVVADGHGSPRHGHKVSHHIVSTLPQLLQTHNVFTPSPDMPTRLRTAISSLDTSAIALTSAARVYAGSTLCAVLRSGSTLFCANVGDSRALVIPALGKPRQLSTDHVCTHPIEKARIEKAGGVVVGGLLNGYISMSRAIGDDDLKTHRNLTPFPFRQGAKFGRDLFTGDADVTQYKLREADIVTVIASDGVWGTLSNDDVAVVVRSEIQKGRLADDVAKAVVKKAISKGSKDNVTAVVAFLRDDITVKTLIGEKRRRKQRIASTTPKSIMNTTIEYSTEDGSDTATSSDGGVAVIADNIVKDQLKHSSKGSRRQRSVEDNRNRGLRRLKWGQRNFTALK